MSRWVPVAREGEIAPGSFKLVEGPAPTQFALASAYAFGRADGLVRPALRPVGRALHPREVAHIDVNGRLCCIEDLCTHDGGNLVEGELEGCVITCPRHGAQFDVCTGEALCLPAVAPTPVHAVRTRDGQIEIEVED